MNESNLPVFTGNTNSPLYELDRVELAFFQILQNQGIPSQRTRDVDTNVTPRVELALETEVVQGRRHNIGGIFQSQFLPYNTWLFKLGVTVVTNREQNGDNHLPLMGLARSILQMFALKDTFTQQLCPTHEIIDIREEGCPTSVWNEGGCDISSMTFAGMFAIRESAWQ